MGDQVGRPRLTNHSPSNIATQIEVWEVYEKTRAIRATSEQTGISRWIVERIIGQDRHRMNLILNQVREESVAKWEDHEKRSQGIIDDLLQICENLFLEIKDAARTGRLTSIRNADGYQMPVLDAIQFMVMTRMMDQVSRLASQAHGISAAFRTGDTDLLKKMGAADGDPGFERMDDRQLAQAIKDGGLVLPPLLAQKMKLLESGVASA